MNEKHRLLVTQSSVPVPYSLISVLIGIGFSLPPRSPSNSSEMNRNHIVFTIFRLIWHQTEFRFVLNQSENGKYNLIPVNLAWIWSRLSCEVRLLTPPSPITIIAGSLSAKSTNWKLLLPLVVRELTPLGMIGARGGLPLNPLVPYCCDVRRVSENCFQVLMIPRGTGCYLGGLYAWSLEELLPGPGWTNRQQCNWSTCGHLLNTSLGRLQYPT